jgi:5'-nucleotidase
MKKIVYVDMDNVLVDFESGIRKLNEEQRMDFQGRYDEVPHIFSMMDPMEKAIESYIRLTTKYDTYILSTSPWENPTAANDKVEWVKRHLGTHAYKRLILSHNKHLNMGDYLIDDREKNGAERFTGKLILFGGPEFPDWDTVMAFLF